MLALKHLLTAGGLGMIFAAVCILTGDLYREMVHRRALETPGGAARAAPVLVRWRTSLARVMLAWGPLLVAFSIVVVPSGMAELLLKEQENHRMGVATELKGNEVRIAELETEAPKVQQIKQAEGEAQVHTLQAQSEADAIQYTHPLKEKQIRLSRLEAQARKETIIQNAEAEARAKVIEQNRV
jgi:hypothetical protein